jgi:hypothetical protein
MGIDLTGLITSVNTDGSIAAGEPGSVDVLVANDGDTAVNDSATVTIYASMDGSLAGAIEVGSTNQTLALGAGDTTNVNVAITVGDDMQPTGYDLIAVVDDADNVDEFDETNNTATAEDALNVVWRFDASNKLTIDGDNAGQWTKVVLRGAGSGEVSIGDDGLYNLAVTGTTNRSQLNFNTRGSSDFNVGSLSVDGALKALIGKKTDLMGDAVFTGGINKIKVDDVDGGLITIGEGSGEVQLYFDEVTDVSISSAMGIRKLQSSSYLDTDNVDDLIVADYINNLQTKKGDFQANMRLLGANSKGKSLGSANIKGTLGSGDENDPAVWEVAADVGRIRSGDTIGFELVGLGDVDIQGLQTGLALGVNINTQGALGVVKAKQWHSSDINAASVKSMNIGGDMTDSRVTITGDAKYGMKSLKAKGAINNVQISSTSALGSITAKQWRDSNVDAPSIKSMNIGGDMANSRVTLTSDTGYALKSFKTRGAVNTVQIHSSGDLGSIRTGDASHFEVIGLGDVNIKSLQTGYASDITITTEGEIGSVKAKQLTRSSIDAQAVKSININGDMLDSRVTLRRSTGAALKSMRVKGTMQNVQIQSAGNLGSIRAGDANNVQVVGLGEVNIKSLQTGSAVGVSVTTDGEIRSIKAKQWHNGIIDALAVKTINIAGDMTNSRITLTRGVEAGHSLKSLNVRGVMDNVQIRSRGNIGSIRAGAMRHSLIDVDTAGGGSINSINVKSSRKAATFVDTTINAWKIGKANLGTVETDNDGKATGVIAHSITSLAARDLVGHKVTSRGSSLRRGDFFLRLVS